MLLLHGNLMEKSSLVDKFSYNFRKVGSSFSFFRISLRIFMNMVPVQDDYSRDLRYLHSIQRIGWINCVTRRSHTNHYFFYIFFGFVWFFKPEKPLVKTYQKKHKMFGSAPYSGRSSSMSTPCSRTVLNRCNATEIRWNKTKILEHRRWSSPIAS